MAIPTFAAFQTASRALTASQTLLNITGNNISNVNTEGYTRQRVDLTSLSNTSLNQKFANTSKTSTSAGVEATGLSQIRDSFLDGRYRNENADNGMYTELSSGLSDLEDVFDEIGTDGLQSQLADFADQLETLSESPTDADVALTVNVRPVAYGDIEFLCTAGNRSTGAGYLRPGGRRCCRFQYYR
jgi:flagellar hook-associated protein 1 FlgK